MVPIIAYSNGVIGHIKLPFLQLGNHVWPFFLRHKNAYASQPLSLNCATPREEKGLV